MSVCKTTIGKIYIKLDILLDKEFLFYFRQDFVDKYRSKKQIHVFYKLNAYIRG